MSNESKPPQSPTAAAHWDEVWRAKEPEAVSWFEPNPEVSLALIGSTSRRVLDVGGGASRLVDALLDRGMQVTVLDLSPHALERARHRLGARADRVTWIVGDVRTVEEVGEIDVWHDRAAFHFLIEPEDRALYRAQLLDAVRPGGEAVIATFAPDGPERCSGLPVQRWAPEALAGELGLDLLESRREVHRTPWDTEQPFTYARLRRP